MSSAEAEYLALALACQEAAYIKQLLEEIFGRKLAPILIKLDNTAAEFIAKQEASSDRTKHVDIRYHFIKDMVKKHVVVLDHVPGTDNVADLFTKNLGKHLYSKHAATVLGRRDEHKGSK